VREDGRIVGGEESQEKVYNREEWKILLRTARNRCILHMPMERMIQCSYSMTTYIHKNYLYLIFNVLNMMAQETVTQL
jgi:hypothetical protein